MNRLIPLALAAALLSGCLPSLLPSVKIDWPSKADRVEAKIEKVITRLQKLRQERLLACLSKYRAESLGDLQNASAACQSELLPIIL